jgi:hypothetical protein
MRQIRAGAFLPLAVTLRQTPPTPLAKGGEKAVPFGPGLLDAALGLRAKPALWIKRKELRWARKNKSVRQEMKLSRLTPNVSNYLLLPTNTA